MQLNINRDGVDKVSNSCTISPPTGVYYIHCAGMSVHPSVRYAVSENVITLLPHGIF